MSLSSQVKQIYTNMLYPVAVRQLTLPAGAAVTTTADAAGSTYGAWADVALLATVLTDTLVTGIVVSAPSATDVFTVQIGSTLVNGVAYANAAAVTAAGAAIILAAGRAEVRTDYIIVGAAGYTLGGYIPLAFPVWIPNGTGIIGRCYGVTAAAVTIDVSAVCVQNF